MTIRKVLVSVDGSAAGRVSLQIAFSLIRSFAAHLEALHVRPDPRDAIPLLGEGVSGAMIDELIVLTERETETRARAARAVFDEVRAAEGVAIADRPGVEGVSAAWVELTGRIDDVVVARGRLADLVVVERPTPETEAVSAMTLNAALYEGGRPVLVPTETIPETIGQRVAIAWDGSAEAARAVSASLTILERADTITVLSADADMASENTAGDLIDYLAWHDISARRGAVAGDGKPVGAQLLDACETANADFLVMGAYTHSRLRELIMGGVTRYVLANATIPVLMAH
ncbi:MAG: universal stress protein [Rhodospirillales bacterium]|nr:universal stress protein [Rhodospirillales bacterium]